MAVAKKKKKVTIGTNVRFNDAAYATIKKHCDQKGYKISSFCVNAAMEKVIAESSKKVMLKV